MANKLLNTVFNINKEIEELKGPYSSLLEGLKNNPEIGEAKFQEIVNILKDTSGDYNSVKDRIEAIEGVLSQVNSDYIVKIKPEIESIEKEMLEASGVYSSLKEAIDNAKDNITIDTGTDEVKIVAENKTNVISKEITIAGGGNAIIPEHLDMATGMLNYLVKRTDNSETREYKFSTGFVNVNPSIEVDSTGSSLKNNGEIGIDASRGTVTKHSDKIYKFANDIIHALSYGDYQYSTKLDKFFVKPNTKTSNDYISLNVPRGSIFMALKNPTYITKIRVFPYSVKNTTTTFQIVVDGPNNNQLYFSTFDNPKPQNHSNWNAYLDIPINDIVSNISLAFSDNLVATQCSFGGIEIYTNDISKDGIVEANSKVYSYETIKRLYSSAAITTGIDERYNNIKFSMTIDGVEKVFVPKDYVIKYSEFETLNSQHHLYGTKLESYNYFSNCIRNSQILYDIRIGKLETTVMPIEGWACSRDINDNTWSDGGNDAFDGWGNFQLYYGGTWQSFSMAVGTHSYVNNGLQYTVKKQFISQNLYRMVIESPNSQRAVVQVKASGGMGMDGGGWTAFNSFDLYGRAYKIFYTGGAGDPSVHFCIIPSDPMESDSPSYNTPNNDIVNIYSNAVKLPITVYIYVGYSSPSVPAEGIKYDLQNSSYGGYINYTDASRIVTAAETEGATAKPYIKKIYTKDWDSFKVSSISSNGDVRYLLSFDKGITWEKYYDSAWRESRLESIVSGMVKDELLNISSDIFKDKVKDYVYIAVYCSGDAYFNALTLDTGSDKIVPISPIDAWHSGMNISDFNKINLSLLSKEFNDKDYEISIGFKAYMRQYANTMTKVNNIKLTTIQSRYWSLPEKVELDGIDFKIYDEYTEVVNNTASNVDLKVNYIKPEPITLIDKGSNEDLRNLAQSVETFRNKENITSELANKAAAIVGSRMISKSFMTDDMITDYMLNFMFKNEEELDLEYLKMVSYKNSLIESTNGNVYVDGSYNNFISNNVGNSVEYSTSADTFVILKPIRVPIDMSEGFTTISVNSSVSKIYIIVDNIREIEVPSENISFINNQYKITYDKNLLSPDNNTQINFIKFKLIFVKPALYTPGWKPDAIPDLVNTYSNSEVAISSSSEYDSTYRAYNPTRPSIVNRHGWITTNGITNGWWQIYFLNPKRIERLRLYNHDYNPELPKCFTFHGSYDGINWVLLDNRINLTSWPNYTWKDFYFVNPYYFKYYKITMSENNGASYVGFAMIDMMERNNSIEIGGHYTKFYPIKKTFNAGDFHISIPFNGILKINIPESVIQARQDVKLIINDIEQIYGVDYDFSFEGGCYYLNWISTDFELETTDKIILRV